MIIYRVEKCDNSPLSRHECAHKLLEAMLVEYTEYSYSQLRKQENGKPYIDGVAFSLSHCEDIAVVAMCVSESKSKNDVIASNVMCKSLGVDAECVSIKSKEKCEIIANRKFFELENKLLTDCLSEKNYIEKFCDLWTKKESYCKLTGEGLAGALNFDTQSYTADVSLYTDIITIDEKVYAVSLCYNS